MELRLSRKPDGLQRPECDGMIGLQGADQQPSVYHQGRIMCGAKATPVTISNWIISYSHFAYVSASKIYSYHL